MQSSAVHFFQHLKRRRALAAELDADYRAFLQAPVPKPASRVSEVEFLAADLEMTGLDAKKDEVLSIGYVPIIHAQICLNDADHHLIHHDNIDLGQSAAIHGIHHAHLLEGEDEKEILADFLNALKGRVLVLHNAHLDKAFLQKLCQRHYQADFLAPIVDTMQIEKKRNSRSDALNGRSIRLDDSRQRYNLPRYNAHNAAIDALATAELLLAQIQAIQENGNCQLKQLMR